MLSNLTRTVVLAALMAALTWPVQAQVTIQFGVTDAAVKRALNAQGYTELKITKRSFTKIHVEACRDGVRHHLRLDPAGRLISDNEIGKCRTAVSLKQARQLLRQNGYRRIDIDDHADGYLAIACLKGQRQRVAVSRFGDIRKQRDLGSCAPTLSPSDISAALREKGYDRIRFTDDRLPLYVAEACREGQRVELELTRTGSIKSQFQIGQCPRPIDPADIADILTRRGYDRVEVVDRRLPRYIAEACRGADRVEVVMNRYGKIVGQDDIGRCPAPISRDQLANALIEQGFRPVSVEPADDDGYTVNVCRDDRWMTASFSRYGEVVDQRDKGACALPAFDALTGRFEADGLAGLEVFVEGCRDGHRLRIRLNGFGEAVERRRIGKC